MIVKLNKSQFDYLNNNLSKKMIKKLKFEQTDRENQFVINIDKNTADRIRDWAGEKLQTKGFGINYTLTSEGSLLEDLIDLFYTQ